MRILNIHSFSTIKSKILQLKTPSISNIPQSILKLVDRKLLQTTNHPLSIIKESIIKSLGETYHFQDNLSPIVSIENNFDLLNIPKDHISRQITDTYYINQKQLLRTHTSAHQLDYLRRNINHFAIFGDVYRRDQIDKFHYPVFHQMQAVSILGNRDKITINQTVDHLKSTLEKIVDDLFGKCQKKWIDAYFPFTNPSFQLEIFYDNKWVEMLGCGVIHDFVMEKAGRRDQIGWAAGLGLQRFAMKLFKIPDVRLFWSNDSRFVSQFKKGTITQFKQFSKYPACYKDISLWITQAYNPNDLFQIIREVGGDLIQNVEQTMTYKDDKTQKVSKGYRIMFRSLQKTLQNKQITQYQMRIRESINSKLKTGSLR